MSDRQFAMQGPMHRYLPQSVDYFLDADSLAQVMISAGLEDVGYLKVGCGTVAIHYGTKM